MAPVASRSGDAVFANIERVVRKSILLFLILILTYLIFFFSFFLFLLHFLKFLIFNLSSECGVIYPNLWSDGKTIAYGFGRSGGSQQAARWDVCILDYLLFYAAIIIWSSNLLSKFDHIYISVCVYISFMVKHSGSSLCLLGFGICEVSNLALILESTFDI